MKSIQDVTRMAIVVAGVSLALSTMPRTALAQSATVTINWNDMHQTIDGFGTAQTGDLDATGDPAAQIGPAGYLYNWPEPQRSQIMDLAFSQATGIGLTIFRSKILPSLESGKGVWNYTDTAQGWLMKEAAKRSPVKLVASVWSPPAWMKTNGSLLRGELKPENYQDFANFLSHYAAEYARTNGVNIYAVSMTNEPDTIFAPDEPAWDTCAWDKDQIASFLANYLRPTFAANRIAAKVIAPETATWDTAESYLSATYNNPTALARLDIAAGHLYGGNASLSFQKALDHGKKIWQTETSGRYSVWNDVGGDYGCAPSDAGPLCGTLRWATDIHYGLTGAQLSGWLWWTLALWRDNGALMELSSDGHSFSVSKTFWALGNFSKFIRPGFVRIGTTSSNASLLTSAYKDPTTGRFVIVAINKGTSALNVRFNTLGFTAGAVTPYVTSNTQDLARQPAVSLANTVSIPARSIVTYAPNQPEIVWRGTDGSVNIWLMTGGAVQSQFWTGSPDTNWTIQGVGDFDGDGVSDLFWRCTGPSCFQTTHGQLAIWHRGQTTNPSPSYPGLVSDDGWQIKGVGDFDGNGKSDLLWQYSGQVNHGQLSLWYNGQATSPPPGYPGAVRDDGWQIQGIGDFDGDGRSDILWRYLGATNHGQLAIWWRGQYVSPVPTYPGVVSDDGWRVKGIGDFDGNGKSEILWQYAGQVNHGQLAVWWNGQNLSPQPWYPGRVGDDNWVIKGIEDFDGDKKSDVLWQFVGPSGHTTHGQLAIWFGAQATNPVPAYPTVVGDNLRFQATGKSGL